MGITPGEQGWGGWKAGQVGAEGRVFDDRRWTRWLTSSSITDSAIVGDERCEIQEKCVHEESLSGLSCVKRGWVRLWLEHYQEMRSIGLLPSLYFSVSIMILWCLSCCGAGFRVQLHSNEDGSSFMLEKWKKCVSNVSVWEILACTMIWPLDHKAWCVFVCFLCGFTFQIWCCFSSTFCRECCKSFPDSLNLDLKSAAKPIRMLLAARFDRLFWLFLLYVYIGKYMIFFCELGNVAIKLDPVL